MSNNNHHHHNGHPNKSRPIIIISLCLFIAVTLCSSAGTVFHQLTSVQNVPPFLTAFWRLFLQNIVQFIPFVYTLYKVWRKDQEIIMKRMSMDVHGDTLIDTKDDNNDDDDNVVAIQVDEENHDDVNQKRKVNGINRTTTLSNNNNDKSFSEQNNELLIPKYIRSMPLLLLSGFALGVHFSLWVYSLRHTSLTHSLLWVTMGPIVLNVGSWVAYGSSTICGVWSCCCISGIVFRKPTILETIGAIVGVGGAGIMLLDIQMNDDDDDDNIDLPEYARLPSFRGNIAAFMGAVAMCLYLVIGKRVRSWLPLWLYVFPVVGFASLTCLIFAFLDSSDRTVWTGWTNKSVFGVFTIDYFFYSLYLGIGPGIFGHTMINGLLRYISPFIISTALLAEPITGSIIGYIFNMQTLPALYTWIGGLVLLIGLVMVVLGESKSYQLLGKRKRNGIEEEPNQD